MKKKILIISFLLLFIFSIFYFQHKETKKIRKDDLNFSFLNEVKSKIDEKFIDTREDKSKKITDDDLIYGAAQGLVASYGDMHTMFFPPKDGEEFSDDLKGEFSGIGVEITNQNGYLTVVSPLPGSPGYKAGLKPKDVIIEINGKNSIHMSSSDAVKLIRGKKGTFVELTVARKGEEKPLNIKIKRDKIKIPIVKILRKDDVMIVKFYSFTENSSKIFYESVVPKIKKTGIKRMILDLRGNSGGYLRSSIFIAGLFLPKGENIVKVDYQGKRKDKKWVSGDWHLNPDSTTNILNDVMVAVLMDAGTASASEILAGALSDHKKAILFGTKTFGKGTVQELIDFSNGSSLKVTVAKFILPNGEWISYKGIRPDIEVKIDRDEIKKIYKQGSFSNYIDKQLDVVVKYLMDIKTKEEFDKKVEEFQEKRKEFNKKEKKKELKDLLNKKDDK